MTSGSKVKKREDKTGRRDEDVDALFGSNVDGRGLPERQHVSDIRAISSKCVCSE